MKHKYYDDDLLRNIRYELFKMKNIEKAKVLIDEYQEMYPEDILGDVYRSHILRNEKKYEEALSVLNDHKYDKFHSDYAEIEYYTAYGLIYQEKNDLGKAEYAYLRAIDIDKSKASRAIMRLVSTYRIEEKYDEALKLIASSNLEHESRLLVEKGNILFLNHKPEEAIEVLEKINDSSLSKTSLNVKYGLLGACYSDLGQYEKSEKYLKKVDDSKEYNIKIKSDYLMNIEYKKGNYDKALEYLNLYLANGGSAEKRYSLMFKLYQKEYKYKEAKELLPLLDVTDESKEEILGSLDMYLGNFEDAKEEIYKSLSHCTSDKIFSDDLKNLAVCYLRTGDIENLKTLIKFTENDIQGRDLKSLDIIKTAINKIEGNKIDEEKLMYSERQIYNYSREDAIRHIKERHIDGMQSKSKFNTNTDVNELYDEVARKIENETPGEYEIFDKYKIDLDGTMVTVVANMNTNEIITMYLGYEHNGNMIELEKDKEKKKVYKRETAMEKWKRRYGNNY